MKGYRTRCEIRGFAEMADEYVSLVSRGTKVFVLKEGNVAPYHLDNKLEQITMEEYEYILGGVVESTTPNERLFELTNYGTENVSIRNKGKVREIK